MKANVGYWVTPWTEEKGSVSASSSTSEKWVRIKGVVVPHSWDSEGNILEIAISGSDEVDYRVKKEGKGLELEGLLHRSVEVSGKVTQGTREGEWEILVVELLNGQINREIFSACSGEASRIYSPGGEF